MGLNTHVFQALVCLVFAVIAMFAGWSLFVSRDLVQSALVIMAGIFCVFLALNHLINAFTARDINAL